MNVKPDKKGAPLRCERWSSYSLLIFVAGFYGAYALLIRGGAFCNAQTFNFVLCGAALGQGDWSRAAYFIIPITAYFLGAFLSELCSSSINWHFPIRWESLLMLFEIILVIFLGLLPAEAPHQIAQVTINLIASMQYNTFRQTREIPMSTTFCTNHLRQIGVAASHALVCRDKESLRRLTVHGEMVLCFFLGAAAGTVLSGWYKSLSILFVLFPLGWLAFVFLIDDLSAGRRTPMRDATALYRKHEEEKD